MMNSIFSFDGVPKLYQLVSNTIMEYFSSLKKYFLKSESAEGTLKNFWDLVDFKDDRSFLNVFWELTSVMGTCVYLYEFGRTSLSITSIESSILAINKHLLDPAGEIRIRTKKASECIARVIDFFLINFEHVVRGDFKQISWSLPKSLQFENEYAAFVKTYQHYQENPLHLEEINKTVVNLRDEAGLLIKTANNEILKTSQGAVKSAMVRYLKELNTMHIALTESLNPNNMKPQPMCVVLVGPPGCGKSSISTNIGKKMQRIAGRTPNEAYINAKGGDPKFETAINGQTEVIIMDDFGNDTDRRIPAKEVLDTINVTREVIPKAAVEEKNRHKYSNVGTIITTNDANVGINQISTISYDSILRRYGLVIFLSIKPEYCVEGGEILNRHHPDLKEGTLLPDIYTIEIKRPLRAVPVNNNSHIEYETIEGWRKPGICDCKCLFLFLDRYLKQDWERTLRQHASRNSPEKVCVECGLDNLVCTCKEEKMLNCETPDELTPESKTNSRFSQTLEWFHEGLRTTQERTIHTYSAFDDVAMMKMDAMNSRLMYCMITKSLLFLGRDTWKDCCENVIYYLALYFSILIPCLMYNSLEFVYLGLFLLYQLWLKGDVFSMNLKSYLFILFCILHSLFRMEYIGICLLTPILCFCLNFYRKRRFIQMSEDAACVARSDLIRSHYYARMFFYSAICGSGVLVLLLFAQKVCQLVLPKARESKRDIANEPYLPVFKPSNLSGPGKYHVIAEPDNKAKTSAPYEARTYIGRKMVVVRIQGNNDFTQEVRGIPMGSEILLPLHALPKHGNFDIEICADYSKRTSNYMSRNVPQSAYTQLKSRDGQLVDAALVNVPNMPTQPDLNRYFTSGVQPPSGPAQELVKNYDGTFDLIDVRITTPGMFDQAPYSTERGRFVGYPRYKVQSESTPSYEGMCGSPIISEDSNCILGFHVCGTGTTTWYALRITSDMILEARGKLVLESKRFISHPVPPSFSVKANHLNLEFEDSHEDLAVHAIEQLISPIEEIGAIYRGADLYADRAEKHYFSNKNPKLEEAFGPRTMQPPQHPNGSKQVNSTLEKLSSPKFDVPIELIDRAAEDYLETKFENINFDAIIRTLKSERDDFYTVRSLEEAKKGDGTGIVRGINNNSSAGCLYGGKKPRHYDLDVSGDPLEERVLKDYMLKDIEAQELEWRSGRGTYDPFKRCSKTNELLPLQKAEDKTRSFYSNDMAFFLNMTRAIIPLKHTLRRSQALSECFVGVAAQSSEWRELCRFLSKDGEYRNFVCGDFSGYDTQLPKALLDKAAWLLVEMARRGGMSESDLQFLRGSLSSVVSPTLFWDGHVLRMANGQPSGQPLTVEINSIVNSLLMRMVFFTIMDEDYPSIVNPVFRNFVRLATYGDDNVLGVSEKIPEYNHTKIQAVFARWGIKYTMADKNADSVPYQTIDEISFLKRSFREHIDLGIVAPIEKESITKCFYYWVRGKNTPLTFQQQFSEFVKSQTREAFLHGPEYYDEFCRGITLLQEGSQEDKPEFRIKWNGYYLPPYAEMLEELKMAYE